MLGAFVNEVNALVKAGKLSPSTASALIAQAQAIMKAKGCT
jgi:hypothetical protein